MINLLLTFCYYFSSRCQKGSDKDGMGECLELEEYRDLCAIVDSECFQECSAVLSPSATLQVSGEC